MFVTEARCEVAPKDDNSQCNSLAMATVVTLTLADQLQSGR